MTTPAAQQTSTEKAGRVKTGNVELDQILNGGLAKERVYLLQGSPGTGKTTVAMQFLLEGIRNNETVLYLTLSEGAAELASVAEAHGWSIAGMNILELLTTEDALQSENQYTMYQPSEVELGNTTEAIIAEVEKLRPSRVVLDSLSELKLLAQSPLRFRRQILALKKFFTTRACTVLFLDDKTTIGAAENFQLESIAHGVFDLEQLSPEYGAERRRLRVKKFRGQKFHGGYHDYTIDTGGVFIFPRIMSTDRPPPALKKILKSGVPQLDDLMGGGPEEGTSVLLLGPAGVGKSTLAMQYAVNAAENGDHAVIYTFDESVQTMLHRAKGINIPLEKYVDAGLIHLQPIDPTEMSPGEFAHRVRKAVAGRDGEDAAKVVVIDSLNGYLNAMPEERFLMSQMHELLTYLGHHGVVTFLVVAQHGLLGHTMQTPLDTSYLSDAVILLRYFELDGEVRQAISVVKKRSGQHERLIREFSVCDEGIKVGEPLSRFTGVLTGTPLAMKKD